MHFINTSSFTGKGSVGSLSLVFAASFFSIGVAHAHGNKVSVSVKNGIRCVVSNGLPNHSTGKFPNSGNPNSIRKQNVRLCMTTKPRKGGRPNQIRGSIGVGVNGVQFRPGTADYYDASSSRGFSRDPSSGWKLDGLGAGKTLGIDANNAHVDHRGLYHYHGIADALIRTGKGSLIGWAADGFEIHYVGSKRRSSYQLKSGKRSNPPGGKHDGTYVQDWRYKAGSGSLDQCNGGKLNGKFVYFATDNYPFLPHCLWGKVSADFALQRGGGQRKQRAKQGANRGGRRPPQQAMNACNNKNVGSSCSFRGRGNRQVRGTCRNVGSGDKACAPKRRPRN